MWKVFFIILLVSGVLADEKSSIEQDLSIRLPSQLLTVSGLQQGSTVAEGSVQSQPRVALSSGGSPQRKYTLVLVDPDAPNRQSHGARSWLHWLAVNISPDSSHTLSSGGQTVMQYRGPSPPPGSGKHRYVFVAYKQQRGDISASALSSSITQRGSFNLASFAAQNNLNADEWFYYEVQG